MAKTRKRLRKKRIKEDQLVTTTLRITTYVQDHFTQVVSGIVILLAAIAIIVFTGQARKNTSRVATRELALAMGQYQLGDKDLASTTFASLADRYSGHDAGVLALYFLGQCNLDRFRFDEALSAFDRYLAKAGKDAAFRVAAEIGRAIAYEGQQQFNEAAEIMDRLSQTMDPADGRYNDVLFNAATFYREAGNREKAIEFYKRVADADTGMNKDRAAVWVTLLQ
jgi:tetratricopeptide (TPR) repeat protein